MKIGLEIHQRLKSNKLFCNCKSEIPESEPPSLIIKRKLHPVLSELGEMDVAALSETHKDREFLYQVFSNTCLVEIDEEPPKKINLEALHIVIDIARHLNATILDEIHIMRKMVIDGSNTSGFQRTAIIAVDGYIESSKGKVRIPLIALEEDSAGIVSSGSDSNPNSATYRLDRLGIPLIEISTSPDIKDAEHLEEVAQKLGMILRASGKVARGLGTIRQDVNVSTEGGSRVEIKGAQDLKMLGEIANGEANRQLELIKLLTHLREKKAIPIEYAPKDVTHIFEKPKSSEIVDGPISMIQNGIIDGSNIIAHKLKNHKGILGTQIQKGKRYGTEISDYAKRSGVKGIIHSDEALEKYGIYDSHIEQIQKELHLDKDDAFFMVIAKKEQALLAIKLGLERINMNHVPGETRKANPDGTTNFMRPIPGRARLYPETDIPPLRITEELLSSVHKSQSLEDKKETLKKLLGNSELSEKILKSRNLPLFEKLIERYKHKEEGFATDPTLIVNTLENTLVSLRREGFEFSDTEKVLTDLFDEYALGKFVKAAIPDILKGMAKGARAEAVIKVYRFSKITGPALEKIVVECNYDLKQIMQKYRLQVDPSEVSMLLKTKK